MIITYWFIAGQQCVIEADKDYTDVDDEDISQIDMVTDLLGNQTTHESISVHLRGGCRRRRDTLEERVL